MAHRFNAIRPHSLTRVPGIGYFANFPGPDHLSSVTKPKSQKPQSFEQALAEIESIVAAMEAGQLPLEQALAAYKRGAELLQYCQAQLQEAQQQVKVLEAGTLQNFSGDNGNE
jgi:exodeoxyribonuclease VII small subunit